MGNLAEWRNRATGANDADMLTGGRSLSTFGARQGLPATSSSGWRRFGARLLDLLLPPTCVLCGAPDAAGLDLCAGCAAALPRNRPACARCALPFSGPVAPGTLCGRCLRRAPPFARAFAAYRYERAVPQLVTGMKFHARLNHARLLGHLLARALAERSAGPAELAWPELIVPVPLHCTRLRQRGYNQSLEIARTLGQALDIPLAPGCCRRVLATVAQTGLHEAARRRNVRGAFTVIDPGAIAGRHLAVLDDVVTTASTVAELSRVLYRAGAARVEVWSVARTP